MSDDVFKVAAYVAGGSNDQILGSIDYFIATEVECIRMVNDLGSIRIPSPGSYPDNVHIVGAVYLQRDGVIWKEIASSETLEHHIDWTRVNGE